MHKLPKYIPLTIGLLIYTLAFAEIFLRLIIPQAIVPRYVTAAPYGIRMNEPGRNYTQSTPETTALIEVNSQGMRANRDFALSKPNHVARIALFGDSYFMGYEANLNESFAGQLEQNLIQAGCSVEVLNFAVSGFGTAEMLKTFEEKGISFAPDLVLFQWHHTDPADNMRSNLYKLEQNHLIETGNSYIPIVSTRQKLEKIPFYREISAHSHLYAAAREKISRAYKNAKTGGALVNPNEKTGMKTIQQPTRPPASALDIALLQTAEGKVRHSGADFYVVDMPSTKDRITFLPSFRLLPDDLRNKANYISPIAAFNAAAAPDTKLYWEKGHRHLTPKGNAISAGVVTQTLLQQSKERLKCGKSQTTASNIH